MKNNGVVFSLLLCCAYSLTLAVKAEPEKTQAVPRQVVVKTRRSIHSKSARARLKASKTKDDGQLVAGFFKKDKSANPSPNQAETSISQQSAQKSLSNDGDLAGSKTQTDSSDKELPVKSSRANSVERTGIGQPNCKADNNKSQPAPGLIPDAAFISVLKDLSRALNNSPDVDKLTDSCQKSAVKTAQDAIAKALDNPQLQSDRLVTGKQKALYESSMTAESWESGEIMLSPHCLASFNAIWAKKLDGLINITVAGNCGCKAASDGANLGEFVFVLSGKSTIDKGFDIQSQSDVNFWLGKMNSFSVDTACCSGPETGDNGQKKSAQKLTPVLKSLITERTRQYFAQLNKPKEDQQQLADNSEKKNEDESRSDAKNNLDVKSDQSQADRLSSSQTQIKADGTDNSSVDFASLPQLEQSNAQRLGKSTKLAVMNDYATLPVSPGAWDSTASDSTKRTPGQSARVLLPAKAVAGQFLTASVVNSNYGPEPHVELSFNGARLFTADNGKALYMVPEEAIPGPTLQVGMPSRPEQSNCTVQILQPLAVPAGPQMPRVDHVLPLVQSGGLLIIEGHSFDGVADHNRVVVDGMADGQVLVSSPVQLEADLPGKLSPGIHSVSVSTAGLTSNAGQFEVIAFEVGPYGKKSKDESGKLAVRVVGTAQSVKVRIKNNTPDLIRLAKGNDVVVSSPGGNNNVIVLPMARLRKGNYKVDARLD